MEPNKAHYCDRREDEAGGLGDKYRIYPKRIANFWSPGVDERPGGRESAEYQDLKVLRWITAGEVKCAS